MAPKGPSVGSRSPASRDCGRRGLGNHINPNGVDPAGAGPLRGRYTFSLPFREFHPAGAGLLMVCPCGAIPAVSFWLAEMRSFVMLHFDDFDATMSPCLPVSRMSADICPTGGL